MKKIFSLLLVLMVVVGSFVACGCNNGGDPTDTGNGSGDQSQIETESGSGGGLDQDPDESKKPDKKEDFVIPDGVKDNTDNDNEIEVN